MSLTNYHDKMMNKFHITSTILEVVKNSKLLSINDQIDGFIQYLKNLEEDYILKTINIITKSYNVQNTTDESEIISSYITIINSENFFSSIDEKLIFVKNALSSLLEDIPELMVKSRSSGVLVAKKVERRIYGVFENKKINALIQQINECIEMDITIDNKRINDAICSCNGKKMTVKASRSEIQCDDCGQTKSLWGVVFEDFQFYNNDGQKAKHGTYEPSRHYKLIIDCIQAKDNKKILPEELETIRKTFGDNPDINYISTRLCLKECKLTKYNNYVPLIVKLLIKKTPYQLTFSEGSRLSQRFNLIMDTYETVKGKEACNRRYYPFFIYKCIEEEFANEQEPLSLLECIHLQSDETLSEHDQIYKSICEVHGFKFRATAR